MTEGARGRRDSLTHVHPSAVGGITRRCYKTVTVRLVRFAGTRGVVNHVAGFPGSCGNIDNHRNISALDLLVLSLDHVPSYSIAQSTLSMVLPVLCGDVDIDVTTTGKFRAGQGFNDDVGSFTLMRWRCKSWLPLRTRVRFSILFFPRISLSRAWKWFRVDHRAIVRG